MAVGIVAVLLLVSIAGVFFLSDAGKGKTYTNVSSIRLQVFGNANEDDVIDQRDINLIQDVIDGRGAKGNLTDANIDGIINQKDIDQVQAIIEHRETRLYYVDVDGHNVSVHQPVSTVVALLTKNVEAVRVLNATSMLIGTDDFTFTYPHYFPDLMSIANVGNRFTPNIEEILRVNPDILFTGTRLQYDANFESKLAAEGANIDVVRLPTWEYGRVSSGILTLSYILDREEEGYAYVKWHDNLVKEINEILDTIPRSERVSVFMERLGTTTVSKGSGMAETMEQGGGTNIAADMGSAYPIYDREWVIGQDPDMIITIFTGGYETNRTFVDGRFDLVADKFSVTDAIKTGDHHAIGTDILTGTSYIVSVVYFAKWFYPEQFKDLDPQAIHQEFIDKFCYGIDLDVSETGVFIR